MSRAPRRIEVAGAQFAPVGPAAWAAVLWLAGFGALLAAAVGRVSVDVALVCGGPALVGLALAGTSRQDREQYVARLCVAALMLPILMVFWAIDQAPFWQLALLFVLAMATFAAATVWMASAITRLAAEPGSTALAPALLGQRVAELAAALGVPATSEGALGWRIDLSPMVPVGHVQSLMLDIDPARGEVVVRERAGATDAPPRDADQASMRAPGELAFDPARPEAQRVTYTSAEAMHLTPERLARVQLDLGEDGAIVRAVQPQPIDHRDAIALFALLVTGSGHVWQPRLFGAGRAGAQGVSTKNSTSRQPETVRSKT